MCEARSLAGCASLNGLEDFVPHLSGRLTGGAFEFGPFDEANPLVSDGENRATSENCGPTWPKTFKYFEAFSNST
jgi:hypothetical protein